MTRVTDFQETKIKTPEEGIDFAIVEPIIPSLDDFLPMLTKAIQEKELQKTLEENNNNDT